MSSNPDTPPFMAMMKKGAGKQGQAERHRRKTDGPNMLNTRCLLQPGKL